MKNEPIVSYFYNDDLFVWKNLTFLQKELEQKISFWTFTISIECMRKWVFTTAYILRPTTMLY